MVDLIAYSEPALRVILFLTGAWVAGHYLCAGNALRKAPHYVKAILMPITVMSGVGMSWAAWFHGSGVAVLFSVPAVICMSCAEALVWRAGAYISDAFDLQARVQEATERGVQLSLNMARHSVKYVTDGIVTESGAQELQASEQRAKENT